MQPLLVVTLLSSLSTPALAQDDRADFSAADQATEEVEAPQTDLAAELGGALVTGNAVSYALNASLAFAHTWTENKLTIGAGANYAAGKVDSDAGGSLDATERAAAAQVLTRKVQGDLRYDRYLTDKDALYVWAGGLHDPFAGYDARVHEQLGYARALVKSEHSHLGVEIGFDWAEEFFVDPQTSGNDLLESSTTYENVLAGRVGVSLSHDFNENVSVSDEANTYVNVISPADVRVLNTASISSKLSDVFSLKLSNQLTFDNVPVEGFRKLDETTLVTFVASIF